MSKTGKRIPISAAKSISSDFGYTQVIIAAFDKNTGVTSVCTYGKSQEDCEQAAAGGNFVKKALGWPPEQCNAKPSRQIRKEKMMSEYAKKCVIDFGEYKLSRELKYDRGDDPEYGNMSYQQLVDDFFKRYN